MNNKEFLELTDADEIIGTNNNNNIGHEQLFNQKKMLKICYEIRDELSKYFNEITDVEIYEFGNYNTQEKCAGFCDISCQNKKIYLQLIDYNTHKSLEPSVIIPTLLHEFAHCVAPDCINPHGEKFYEAYKSISIIAKQKNIYNFTYNGHLKRLDMITILNMPIKVGHSEKYPDNVKLKNMIRIQVDYKSTIKSYFYDDSIDLYTFIKNKFNIKKDFIINVPKKLTTNCIVKVIMKNNIEKQY